MALAFLVWIYAFRGFLSGHLSLESDALSYYDHIKFYIESLSQGVFPLWDPFWYQGAPNDFFLRRIGAYNPFYSVILIFKTIGIPYTLSYLWFLAAYYFLGMIGFYLLMMRIYKDQRIAFIGFLLLLFSALGTRLFDSYMMLVTVPLIWFFYFLTAFCQQPKKHLLLGMTLAFAILATTYIPFYFLMFLCVFILCYSLLYWHELKAIALRLREFLRAHQLLVALCLLMALLVFIPMLLFIKQSSASIALPGRHGIDVASHVLTVPVQTLKWGVIEDLLYSSYFSNLHRYKFAIVYVPFFAVLCLALGLFCRMSRRLLLFFICAFILFCAIVPHGLPFYDLLNKHLFFMKYFRNLHFFLWFVLIPLFVLLVVENLRSFFELKHDTYGRRWLITTYVIAVHIAAFVFIWWRGDVTLSTSVMLALSLIFIGAWIWGKLNNPAFFYGLVSLMIIAQPLEGYWYLAKKAIPHKGPYEYDIIDWRFKLSAQGEIPKEADGLAIKAGLYYASKAYNELFNEVSDYAMMLNSRHKISLVDRLKVLDDTQGFKVLESSFRGRDNLAFVVGRGDEMKLMAQGTSHQREAILPQDNSPFIKAELFDANHLRLRTDLPSEKFLVYNDSYDPQWQAFINGRQVNVFQTNGAFKGVWVPAGHAEVEFRYGLWWQYCFNVLLLACFYVLLALVLWFAWKERFRIAAIEVGER